MTRKKNSNAAWKAIKRQSINGYFVAFFFISFMSLTAHRIPDRNNITEFHHFDVLTEKNAVIHSADLLNKGVWALFIFKPECPFCDRNIPIWKKLEKKYGKLFDAIGIFLDSGEKLERFQDQNECPFQVVRPQLPDRFKNDFKVTENFSKTIIISGHKIVFEKTGDLTFQDYLNIKTILKQGGSR